MTTVAAITCANPPGATAARYPDKETTLLKLLRVEPCFYADLPDITGWGDQVTYAALAGLHARHLTTWTHNAGAAARIVYATQGGGTTRGTSKPATDFIAANQANARASA